MAKNKISDYSNVAANNTDVGSINIAEGCAPSGINNAIRELMAQLKDFQTGTDGDNFTVGGALSVTGASNLTGVLTLSNALAPTSGGTGFASYTIGDIVYASSSTALSKLPIASSGNVLRSGSVPSWGKVNLTTDVTGALPAANGGTGTTTSTGTGSLVLNTSPALAGVPTAPTATTGTNTTQIATTAFVQAAVTASSSGLADTGANGIVVRTALGTTTARTITNGTGITVSNGDGVSANPVISVSNLGINTSQLADSSVTTAKIANAAITAAKLDNFANSISSTGYQKFPGGLMIQWGFISGAGSGLVVTFPQAFGTACYSFVAAQTASSSLSNSVSVQSVSTTGATVATGGTATGFYWVAIGT